MIVFAALATALAIAWTYVVYYANSSKSSSGEFFGSGTIAVAWIGVAILWLAWWFN